MPGMPILEFSNWLHQVTALYTAIVPTYIFINNFVGPRVLEPVFCRDYLIAQFDKIATKATPSAANNAPAAVYVPTPGKAPQIAKQPFLRAPARARVVGLAACGLMAAFRPSARQ